MDNNIVTRISLDGTQPVQTLKTLRAEVQTATSAWKAQSAELKSAGDSINAAKAKYEGLGTAVEKQRVYLEKQKETLKDLREQQSEVNTSTEKGRNDYENYARQIQQTSGQIASATTKLGSLESQQDRAKNSLKYYESGLANAQNELRKISDSSKAYVDRLEAEGKHEEANKASLKGLSAQYSKLTDVYKKQSGELDRIAEKSGKSSEEYRKQKIRVDETATSMAKTKTQMGKLNDEVNKVKPSIFTRLKNKITGVNDETEKTGQSFKSVFGGAILGAGVIGGLAGIGDKLKDIATHGIELNKTIGSVNSKFQNMGLSSKEINTLDKQISHLKASTRMSGAQVADLQTKMLNWSKIGVKGAGQLTEAMAGIGDSSKLSGDQMTALSGQIMRVGSTGKVSFGQVNRIAKTAPTLYAAMAQGAGVSIDKMKEMLSTGKVTQKQFQQWIADSQDYAKTAEKNFGQTQAGAKAAISATWDDIQAKMGKPLFNAETSGLQSLKNIMTSPEMQKGITAVGKGVGNVMSYLDKHKKDISEIVKDVVKIGTEIGKDIWKTFSGVVINIAKSFGLISDHGKKSGDNTHQFAEAMKGLAKNKGAIEAISKAIIAIAAIKTMSAVLSPLNAIANLAPGENSVLSLLTKGAKGGFKGLQALKSSGAFQSLKSAGGFKGLSTAGKVATGAAAAGVAIDAGTQVYSAVKDKHNATARSKDIGGAVGTVVGGGIGMALGGPAGAAIGAQVGKFAGTWGGGAADKFTKGWQKKKPPKKFWSMENLGWSTKDMLDKAGKETGKVAKGIGKGIGGAKKWTKKNMAGIGLLMVNPIAGGLKLLHDNNPKFKKWSDGMAKNMKNGITKFGKDWSKGWKGASKTYSSWTKKNKKGMDSFNKNLVNGSKKNLSKFKKGWDKHWSQASKTVGSWSDKTHKNYTKGVKYLEKSFQGYTKKAGKDWKKHWNNLTKNVGDFWHDSEKANVLGTGKALKGIEDHTKKAKKTWQDHYEDLKKAYSDYSKDYQKNHGNSLKTIEDMSDKSMKNLKKGFSDKWDEIQKNTGKSWDGLQKAASDWGKNINDWQTKFGKGWNDGWNSIWNGVNKVFNDSWSKIKQMAADAMNALIGIINGAINGINGLIHDFGGGKKTIGTIGKVKFATGTGAFSGPRRTITKPTLATLNDGNDSPQTGNKEGLIHNGQLGIVQGTNTDALLMPGDEVLNASEMALLMGTNGMEHFANGTGFLGSVGNFFGGLGSWVGKSVDGLKKYFDEAMKVIKDPGKALDSVLNFGGYKSYGKALGSLSSGLFKKGQTQAKNWWSTLWSMVSGQLDGGGAEGGLLGAVEKYGKGKPYVWGATGPDSFDCSGLVMYALQNAFHKSFPHYSGSQYSATKAVSDPQAGDLVFFGPGGNEHVGVYAGGGKYFSAQSPDSNPNIGMAPVSAGPSSIVSYRRVPGLSGEGASEGSFKGKNALENFIHKQVGGGFWSFISKLSGLFGIDADSDPGGTGVSRWEQTVIKALKQNGFEATPSQVSAWMKVIKRESNGNPKAVNNWDSNAQKGTPSKGLVQTIQPTFDAYAYSGHHNILNGYDNLLAGINYMKHKYGSGASAFARVSGPMGYANGGIATHASIFGEAGAEMAIPLSAAKSSRSYELIGKTASIMAAQDQDINGSAITSKLENKIDTLVSAVELLVQSMSDQAVIKNDVYMDKTKIGKMVTDSVSKAMASKFSSKRRRLSGI